MASGKNKFKVAAENRLTLDEAFTDFIQEKQGLGRSADTIRNYELSYSVFYDYHNLTSSFLLEQLTEKMFYQWFLN